MIKKTAIFLFTAVALVLWPASAGAAPARTTPAVTASPAASCSYVTKHAVYLRANPTTNSTGLAWIGAGQKVNGPCSIVHGQRLNDCLPGQQTDILWTGVYRGQYYGWIFTACLRNA